MIDPFAPKFYSLNNIGLNIGDGLNYVACEQTFTLCVNGTFVSKPVSIHYPHRLHSFYIQSILFVKVCFTFNMKSIAIRTI